MKRFTIPEAARITGHHPNTIRRAIYRYQDGGEGLEAHEPKGTRGYRITDEALNEWLNGH